MLQNRKEIIQTNTRFLYELRTLSSFFSILSTNRINKPFQTTFSFCGFERCCFGSFLTHFLSFSLSLFDHFDFQKKPKMSIDFNHILRLIINVDFLSNKKMLISSNRKLKKIKINKHKFLNEHLCVWFFLEYFFTSLIFTIYRLKLLIQRQQHWNYVAGINKMLQSYRNFLVVNVSIK